MNVIAAVGREALFLSNALRSLVRVRKVLTGRAGTAADMIEEVVRRAPDAVAIRFEGRQITYREYERWGNRYAAWARSQRIGRGDVVAILMENRPEYLFAWLGMAKVGATSALINTNLTGAPLAHCLRVSEARHLVLGRELADAYAGARELLESQPEPWLTGAGDAGAALGGRDLDAALANADESFDASVRDGLESSDKLFYIYTSGTTGNPKAANISHTRFLSVSHAFAALTRATERDRVYVVLPIYHSAGGMCAVGLALSVGATIVLRRKFSASQFWSDCRENGVTLFQYIGELCRYLVNSPPQADEQRHQIRLCIGNGLRPEIWESFQQRFAIPRIIEFYGATEGNVAILNLDGKVGSIGRIPPYLRRLFGMKLIRFDIQTEAPVRDADGFCIECEVGEAGEAIGLIPNKPSSVETFEGYTSAKDTEKKILHDAFEKGDRWFRTGDLLRHDDEGYYYFVDRIGDTFRWKGENVATSEVAEVLSVHPGVKEANVYGVEIAGTDGRAGMAALVAKEGLDLDALYAHVESQLAAYARPLFLRLTSEMVVTGTFKHRKIDLVAEGFDPATVREELYFADAEKRRYVPLDAALHERIVAGELRL